MAYHQLYHSTAGTAVGKSTTKWNGINICELLSQVCSKNKTITVTERDGHIKVYVCKYHAACSIASAAQVNFLSDLYGIHSIENISKINKYAAASLINAALQLRAYGVQTKFIYVLCTKNPKYFTKNIDKSLKKQSATNKKLV